MKFLMGKWYIGFMIRNSAVGNRMPDDLYVGIGNLTRERMERGLA